MKDRIQLAIKEARANKPGQIIPVQDIYEYIYKAGVKEVVEFIETHIFPLLKETSIPVYFKDRWNEAIKKWLE